MSDEMIKVGGKQMSEDTIIEALKAYCDFEVKPPFNENEAPLLSVMGANRAGNHGGRLVIKLTPTVKKTLTGFLSYDDNTYVSIEPCGSEGSCNMGKIWTQANRYYADPLKAVFENYLPTPKL